MWAKIAAGIIFVLTLGIKARRQAAREKAQRKQDELIALRERLIRTTKGASER